MLECFFKRGCQFEIMETFFLVKVDFKYNDVYPWIYNYLHNQCLSPLKLWIRIPFKQGVLDTTLCDKVCQWLAAGRWFSPGTSVSSTNKTDRHDITEIVLKVALNTITLIPNPCSCSDMLGCFFKHCCQYAVMESFGFYLIS
jgi:hypothetical protein